MRFRERDQSSIRSYQRISLGKRKRLIEMVTSQDYSLSKASKKLQLKLSTARLILKKFKETGTFPMRNFKKKTFRTDKQAEVQEEQVQRNGDDEKQNLEEEIKIEQSAVVNYYFVNEMPSMAYFYSFWPAPVKQWM